MNAPTEQDFDWDVVQLRASTTVITMGMMAQVVNAMVEKVQENFAQRDQRILFLETRVVDLERQVRETQ